MVKRRNTTTYVLLATTIILALVLLLPLLLGNRYRGYDSATVLTRIVYIQELALVQHNHLGVIDFRDERTFLNQRIPFTGKFFLLRYTGYVKAGIDFSRVKVNVLDDGKVHVSIPRPQILTAVIDPNSIRVHNESTNIINQLRMSDFSTALAREKNVMVNYAIEQGIFARATERAKLTLRLLLSDMGFTNIEITEELFIPIF